jgi:Xaa-Pro aminopeptidase
VGEIDEIPAALGELTRNRARIGLIGDVPFWHLEEVEAKVVDLKPESDPLLWIKSPDEIQEVALLGSRLVRDIERTVSGLSQGTTEQEIANILRGHLHADGGREAFPTSIVSGERLQTSTLGAPSNRPLGPAEALCIDCGIESRAVFSDCTRMYFLPGSPLASSYARLCDVQKRVIYQIAPGMTFGAIAKLFGEELALCGFVNPNLRLTELGHGIGFALHETPFLMNAQSEHVQVVPGMVFTLEPEISVNGYQIRVEDMVAITSTEAILLTS